MIKTQGFTKTQTNQLITIVGEVVEKKLDTKLKPIHKKIDKLQGDLDTAIKFFDRITLDHDIRINKIENHLHLQLN